MIPVRCLCGYELREPPRGTRIGRIRRRDDGLDVFTVLIGCPECGERLVADQFVGWRQMLAGIGWWVFKYGTVPA